MNKEEYLKRLTMLARGLPQEDKEEIISDYEEHFRIGMEKGRSEEEISEALGDPKTVIKQFKAEYKIREAETKPSTGSMLEAILAAAGLGIFNLIFIAGPFLILVIIILILYLIGLVVTYAGIFILFSTLFKPIFPQVIHSSADGVVGALISIGGGILLVALGLGIMVLVTYASKWFYKLMIRYLKLNMGIIKRHDREAT